MKLFASLLPLLAAAVGGCAIPGPSGTYRTAEGTWSGRLTGVAYEHPPRAADVVPPHVVAVIKLQTSPPIKVRSRKTDEVMTGGIYARDSQMTLSKHVDAIMIGDTPAKPYYIVDGRLFHPTLRGPDVAVGDYITVKALYSDKGHAGDYLSTDVYPGDQIITKVIDILKVDAQ